MPTITRPRTTPVPPPSPSPVVDTAPRPRLADAVASASATVLELAVDDPRWATVGPHLTAFVDAARRVASGVGSPIGPTEDVSVVLRLRDLGRLAQLSGATGVTPPAEVTDRLRSLQHAARR